MNSMLDGDTVGGRKQLRKEVKTQQKKDSTRDINNFLMFTAIIHPQTARARLKSDMLHRKEGESCGQEMRFRRSGSVAATDILCRSLFCASGFSICKMGITILSSPKVLIYSCLRSSARDVQKCT